MLYEVITLIVSLVWEIFRTGARAAQTGAYGRDSIRAELLAEGGISAAKIALREDAGNNSFDTLDEVWSRPVPPIELGEGTIRVAVEDEERKINLNKLILPNGNAPDDQKLAVFRRLLEILEVNPALAGITSYNVCYTKLLRIRVCRSRCGFLVRSTSC